MLFNWKKSANSDNTLNIESVSKTENSTKSSIVIASSYEKPSADENGRKLDMILNEISKLNSKLSKKIKPRKQANEVPKSDEHSNKLINQLNHCKTIADLCESFDYLSYISQEESLVCNICVIYPSQGGSHSLDTLPIISKMTISVSLPRYFYEISVI